MTDIIERLRKYQKAWANDPHGVGKAFGEAADEIEKLRIAAAVDRAWAKSVEVVDSADEIERLRAALEVAWWAYVRARDEAAGEIERLRAQNEALLKALQDMEAAADRES